MTEFQLSFFFSKKEPTMRIYKSWTKNEMRNKMQNIQCSIFRQPQSVQGNLLPRVNGLLSQR